MLLKSILLALLYMIPIATFVLYQISKAKRIKKDLLILEKSFETESVLLKHVKQDSEQFLEWNFIAFIEDYEKHQVNIQEYVSKYLEYYGTNNEFHTFRSEEQ